MCVFRAHLSVIIPSSNGVTLSIFFRTNSDKEVVGKLTTAGYNLFVQGYSEADQLIFSATLALEVQSSTQCMCVCVRKRETESESVCTHCS